jgi:putative transposase
MKKSRFSESQIVAILKEREAGIPVAQLLRKRGISQVRYYVWKSRFSWSALGDLTQSNDWASALS